MRFAVRVAVIIGLSAALVSLHISNDPEHPPHLVRAAAPVAIGLPLEVESFAEVTALAGYVKGLEDAEAERQAAAAKAAAEAERMAATRAPSNVTVARGGTCEGFAIPGWIVWRESRCDYNAINPSSGAYGAYQIIPSTWAASCADLPRTPAGQDDCARRLPASAWG